MHPIKCILRIVTGFRNFLQRHMGKRAIRSLGAAIAQLQRIPRTALLVIQRFPRTSASAVRDRPEWVDCSSSSNSTERPLMDAQLPFTCERPVYIVDPSLITGDRAAVPDPEQPLLGTGTGHRNRY